MSDFKFNLLPKKSEEEIQVIERRDNTIFYSILIVFFSSIVWLISALLLTMGVEPQLEVAEQNLARSKAELKSLDYVHIAYGELVTKADKLAPLLSKRINTELIFTVSVSLTNLVNGAEISTYGRESDGKFLFVIVTDDLLDIESIMSNARNIDFVNNLELRSVTVDKDSGLYSSVIAMDIIDLEIEETLNNEVLE